MFKYAENGLLGSQAGRDKEIIRKKSRKIVIKGLIRLYILRLKCRNANMDKKLQPSARVNAVFGNKQEAVAHVSRSTIITWALPFSLPKNKPSK